VTDSLTPSRPRRIVLLGSTGSIGTQALDLVHRNRDRFEVVGLSAGANVELLAEQAVALRVPVVAAASGSASDLAAAIGRAADAAGVTAYDPELLVGAEASTILATREADVVVNGITGAIGLEPTLAALRAGTTLALANKESLIVGGPLVKALAKPGQIVPVDSEHSALAQCLRAGERMEVRRLILTASGGPFRGRRRADLAQVTPEQALAHPTWKMGPVVTINSATLVNKALEVIEAHLLFDLPLDRIDVVVHPQSVVHSMVEFADGSTLAQCSPPDMRLPIALGLHWPARVPDAVPACDWKTATAWTFEPLDDEAFPAVALARRVGAIGGTAPAIFNAANEEAVAAFLAGNLSFTGIVDTVERVVEESLAGGLGNVTVAQLSDVLDAETSARARARELISAAAPTNPTLGDTA
jgi:1-deoxy-D-xylulose-5-phosphate reductoisomerase